MQMNFCFFCYVWFPPNSRKLNYCVKAMPYKVSMNAQMDKLIFGPTTFAFSMNTRLIAVKLHHPKAANAAYAAATSSPPLNATFPVMTVKPMTPPTKPCTR